MQKKKKTMQKKKKTELEFLLEIKCNIECIARYNETLAVCELRATWSEEEDKEASERFDIQMLYPQLIEPTTYPKFKEEYRKYREIDAYPPEAILFFDRFISQYYLKKSELDFLEEAFSIYNIKISPLKFKHYEHLCLKIALLEREMFEKKEKHSNNMPETKKIPPTRNIARRTGEIHHLPNKKRF